MDVQCHANPAIPVGSVPGPVGAVPLERIHEATLKVLAQTGLRVDCADFHAPLSRAGAAVDRATGVARFPPELVNETISFLRSRIEAGDRQYILNGVTNPRWTPPSGFKFGGACIEYLDPDTGLVRRPTEQDLIGLLQLGEALPDVGFVGNPVTCLLDSHGKGVPGPMQRIRTAALVAKYTTKHGSTEVWNDAELEFLIEIGSIVRGGAAAYRAAPCFVTARETVAPLQFPAEDGRVLLMLARGGLPCTIIPMPITGSTSPCSIAANVVMANAEILGTMVCIHCAVPEAMIAGGVISGSTDMTTGAACFASPEALVQDALLARLFDEFYGQDLAIGTGYIDAKYPGAQSLAEKALKMQAAASQGRYNFPVGLLAGGKRFCPVQALMELDVAASILRAGAPIPVSEDAMAVDVINEVGIGGEFLSHVHTLNHFRGTLRQPLLMDRRLPATIDLDRAGDMIEKARERVRSIRAGDDRYVIDADRAEAIDEVVRKAERILNK